MSALKQDDGVRPSNSPANSSGVGNSHPKSRGPYRRRDVFNRFWEKVQQGRKEDCWPWIASRDEAGYGRFWQIGRMVGAHRVAYELAKGPVEQGRVVMHRCDNPSCCNPHHLSLGTAKDNSDDKVAKGRQACGESHGRAKLTNANVEAILASKSPLAVLATLYRVSKSVISSIRRRRHRRGHLHSGDGNG